MLAAGAAPRQPRPRPGEAHAAARAQGGGGLRLPPHRQHVGDLGL